MSFWKELKKAVRYVAPVVAIFAPEILPLVGNAILGSAGVTGASAAVTSATGAAALGTTGALLSGATPEQALKAGAAAGTAVGVGMGVTGATGSAVVGGAAGGAAGTVVGGGTSSDILRNAIAGGSAAAISGFTGYKAAGGLVGSAISSKGDPTQTVVGGITGAISDIQSPAKQVSTGLGIKAKDTGYGLGGTGGLGLSDKTALSSPGMGGGTGLIADPTSILPQNLQRYSTSTGKMSMGDTGLQPAYGKTSNLLLSDNLTQYSEPYTAPSTVSETQPMLTEQQKLKTYSGRSAVPGSATAQALGTTLQAPLYPAAGTSGLTAARGAGEIEGQQTGKSRQNVWNEESLRLKDALGL